MEFTHTHILPGKYRVGICIMYVWKTFMNMFGAEFTCKNGQSLTHYQKIVCILVYNILELIIKKDKIYLFLS